MTGSTGVQFLDNTTIHDLLINLSRDEAINLRNVMERTFEDFSVGGERQYQSQPSFTNRPNGQSTLFRPFTSNDSVGTKISVEPTPDPDGKKGALHGVIVLCDGNGIPTGLLSSEEVTGYRTSMNAMVPFSWRKHVDDIVIFGSGMQALWHTRLILTLRGSEVKRITYVSSGKHRIDELILKVSRENGTRWNSECVFDFIGNTTSDFQQRLEARLRGADCIFCTTPSKKPLFPMGYLGERDGRRPFISAVGSWQSDMIELDPALLHLAVAPNSGYNPITQKDDGVILVDDREFGLTNSGELVQAEIAARNVVELGEVISIMGKEKADFASARIAKTKEFISEGFVIYKSVGVSLTDLTISNAILQIAREKTEQPRNR
ncbi:Ornithine cyclodeaminase/mu-crystallin family protein [Penicillium brevicompactum]|uniref:uncharacterized protein n=1 Tax=Penicillium brevicompactum TaxID=5074 RepID=UPI00253F6AE7|nr:uncharacterized protein N7506_004943 [Penicillium brevicompactum]KAJ5336921.1 hypothetical protein N7506_004943 [Penicillium brevicompactum]